MIREKFERDELCWQMTEYNFPLVFDTKSALKVLFYFLNFLNKDDQSIFSAIIKFEGKNSTLGTKLT